jgi:hypothetical protein
MRREAEADSSRPTPGRDAIPAIEETAGRRGADQSCANAIVVSNASASRLESSRVC